MEKITRFSGPAYALRLRGVCLWLLGLIIISTQSLNAQLNCEPTVPSFTIIIDELNECIDILDVNPDGICCPDSVASGGCVTFEVTLPENSCLSLLRNQEVAEGQFFVDECTNSQRNGSNITPPTPQTTSMSFTYCTTDDGSFDFQLCAKPCCTLDVECPTDNPIILSCVDQVPDPVQTIAQFLQFPGARINDFCDPLTISGEAISTLNDGCVDDTIFISHVYTIKDPYDSIFCTRTYKVVDDISPVFTVPADTTIDCDASTDPISTGEVTDASDNCNGMVTVEFVDRRGLPNLPCTQDYLIVRLWTVTDPCGNTATGTQSIMVQDTTPPTYDLPRDTMIDCQTDTTAATLGMPTNVMDNCEPDILVSYRDELVTSPCPMAYTVWRIWEFEDGCNNIALDTQTIQVADTVPPSYILPANMNLDCSADTTTASTGVPTALDDNCHMVTVSYRDVIIPTGTCPANYDFFRIWTMVDECGNTVVDTQRFSVRDNTPPVATAPGDTTVSCSANLSPVNLGQLVDTSDNCSDVIVEIREEILSQDCPGTYTFLRIWDVEDLCGNGTSVQQEITVVDTTPPDVVFPSDMIIACLGDTSPTATGMPMGMDDCSGDIIISYNDVVTPMACAAEYLIEREWIVADSCDNEVRDTQMIQAECIESIGLAKAVYDIDPPSSLTRGNFNATLEFTFSNNGNTKLGDIQLAENLALAYRFNFVGITPGGEPKVTFSSADTTPVLNPAFNGQNVVNIFDGNSGCLQPGQRVTIRLTAEINPQLPGTPKERRNQAVISASGPCMQLVIDSSDTGFDPAGLNPGELGDTGGEDDPTILPLECVGPGAPPMACNQHTNISLDENCSLDIPASVILEGEEYICDMFYELMITDHHGNIVPSPIPGDLKGETLYVKVIDAIFGNSCWGTILVEDKFKPTIECVGDTVYCNALDSVPAPVHYDNCDPDPVLTMVRITKEDLTCDPDFTQRVIRFWQAVDNCGNKSDICRQVIMLRRVPLDSIEYPKDYTLENNCALKCNGMYPVDSMGNPDPSWTGAPSIDGVPLYPYYLHCNISTDYSDRIIKDDGCVKKIMRIWRVVEWHCSNSAIREVPQLIHIIDDEAPVIVCPTVDYVTTNGGYNCEADVWLPPAFVYDSCSFDSVRVDIIYPGGILKDQNGGTVTLPFGTHQIKYVAYDQCYNSSECILEVEVQDHTPPVTICDGFTTVGLNEFGEAHLYAEALDDGTYDDCYLDSFAVMRMDMGANCGNPDTTFRPFIRFCCDDVDSSIMVIFRAWDKAGNFNDCMVEVEVQDKVAPVVYCPPNITVSCDFHFSMDSLGETFGYVVQNKADRQAIVINDPNFRTDGPLLDGFVLENCDADIEEMVVDSISQCRTGEILRGFTITDRQGLQSQCYQRITIIDFDPFDSLDITWPLPFETDVCGTNFHPDSLPIPFGRPQINDDICSLVGMEWDDHVFSFVQDSLVCYKVLRKWKIIDWCDFRMEGNTQVYQRYEYEQIIKVNNSIGPVLTMDCEDVTVCTYDPDCEDGQVTLSMSATDDCTPDADLRWSYQIDVFRDGILDTAASGVGSSVTVTEFYPIGKHFIYWTFEDQCGNKTTCQQPFEVVNCKAPTAYCKNGLVVDLMPVDTSGDGIPDVGIIDVWANDLDDGSHHACGNRVVLSFSRDTSDTFRRFTCDSLGMREVTIYVTDPVSGEISSCKTFVEVQDNQNACPMTSGMISGRLQTELDDYIDDVFVDIKGSFNAMESFDGVYQYDNLPLNGSYTIKPIKDDDHMNGVSTKDLVILQRYLLGMTSFNSPYQYIAADTDNDQEISAADMVAIRKLILGHFNRFQNVTSWRFVDSDYTFLDPGDPLGENFLESFNVFDMTGNMVSVDFTGLKVGDLDGSAEASGWNGNNTRSEINYPVSLITQGSEVKVVAGKELIASGLQMTLDLGSAATHLSSIDGGVLNITDQDLGMNQLDKGLILIAHAANGGISINEGDVLMTLSFDDAIERQDVQLINYPLQSEIYSDWLETESIVAVDVNTASGLTVHQNQPNPFDRSTKIGIESDNMIEGEFTVFDASGRVFISQDLSLLTGVNVIEVNHTSLAGTGVYYYQVSTTQGTITKKMILIE